MMLDNISFENFTFISNDENIKYNYKLLITEYLNGKKIHENVMFETNGIFGDFIDNKLNFAIIGKPFNNNEYHVVFNINSNLYLKEKIQLIDSEKFEVKHFFNQKMNFISNEKNLLFAIVKPIKIDENNYRTCDFSTEKQNPSKWFETFGIDNYVTIEIIFE